MNFPDIVKLLIDCFLSSPLGFTDVTGSSVNFYRGIIPTATTVRDIRALDLPEWVWVSS
jgi:hypothetical protein